MAKTKSHVEREQKRAELIRVAKQLLLEDGYDATSMSRIAQEARVAPNTLYWYFVDKDALLIAVLDTLVDEVLSEFEKRRHLTLEAQLLWVLQMFSSAKGLIGTVHARAVAAASVRTWHTQFHQMLESTIEAELRRHGLAHGAQAHAALTTMFVFEGLLAHPRPKAEERALIHWLLSLIQPAPVKRDS